MQSPKPKIHDLAILNARVLDVFTGALDTKTVLIEDGLIHGFGSEPAKETFEAKGAVLLPSLIDSNVHIESPMLSPASFASLVLPFGTTTVTADPHEMTNLRHARARRDLPGPPACREAHGAVLCSGPALRG